MPRRKKKNANNGAESSSVPMSSQNKNVNTWKPNPKIAKKSSEGISVVIHETKAYHQGQKENIKKKRRKKKKKSISLSGKESHTGGEGGKNVMTSKLKQEIVSGIEQSKEGNQSHQAEEKIEVLPKTEETGKDGKKHDKLEKSGPSLISDEKHNGDSGKLGGLIFMCSRWTKPDCFRYHVMGVTLTKRNLILDIKPGLTLFLYDFNLKLMHGVFRASSCGGMRLEPAAFGGAFPVQVRFSVDRDCIPLPESVFREAIKENYNMNKFKTELTFNQVRKLSELFRPVEIPLKAPAAVEGPRESQSHIYGELHTRKHDEVRMLPPLSYENGQPLSYREHSMMATEVYSRKFLPSVRYQTYDHHMERSNCPPPISFAATASQHHRMSYQTEHLFRQPSSMHRDIAAPLGELVRHEQHLLNEGGHQTCAVGSGQGSHHILPSATPTIATLDTYPNYSHRSSQYAASSMVPYAPSSGQEGTVPGPYSLGASRGNFPLERNDLQGREAYMAASDHMEPRRTYLTQTLQDGRRENDYSGRLYATDAPVSSRYSFPGPSLSYR